MMKLFVFYIGGGIEGAVIELHDFRMAVAETLEDSFEFLKKSWWGKPSSLHLDCWGELQSADGYNIHIAAQPQDTEDKLWFVNLGGYAVGDFTELHKNVFVVAPTLSKAKVRALQQIRDWRSHHVDEIYEVENALCMSDAAQAQGYFIHLEKTDAPAPFEFECGYWPIGKDKGVKSVVKKRD